MERQMGNIEMLRSNFYFTLGKIEHIERKFEQAGFLIANFFTKSKFMEHWLLKISIDKVVRIIFLACLMFQNCFPVIFI